MAQSTHIQQHIPVLDISRLDAGSAERVNVLDDLGAAARDYGFFYLVGHGIDASDASRLATLTRRFLAFPDAEKRAIETLSAANFRTDRLSIGFFLGANLDSVAPALTLPPALAARARGVPRDPSDPLLRQVGLNALKGRLRSRPEFAQHHHADLLASLDVVRSAVPVPA